MNTTLAYLNSSIGSQVFLTLIVTLGAAYFLAVLRKINEETENLSAAVGLYTKRLGKAPFLILNLSIVYLMVSMAWDIYLDSEIQSKHWPTVRSKVAEFNQGLSPDECLDRLAPLERYFDAWIIEKVGQKTIVIRPKFNRSILHEPMNVSIHLELQDGQFTRYRVIPQQKEIQLIKRPLR